MCNEQMNFPSAVYSLQLMRADNLVPYMTNVGSPDQGVIPNL